MKLYLVPTPVGNLEDITLRALRVLKEVDFILCEDTRTSGTLLQHFEIKQKLIPFHMHNEHQMLQNVLDRLLAGASAALITDAGSPGISDPGFLLARACIEKEIPVESLPGATAFVPALTQSGLPCNTFAFEGFLPVKKGRKTKLAELVLEKRTMIFYESPHRVVKLLTELAASFGGERQASVSREISKIYEETVRGSLSELKEHFENQDKIRGEFVIVVAGNPEK